MKRLHLLSILLWAMSFIGCSYNALPEELVADQPTNDRIVLNVETRAETYDGIELDRNYFVTAADLENFVEFRRSTSKRSDLSVKEVKSYGFDSSQTLFYILNYDEGWEVVAADKRVQPTLAHGDSGEFTMDCDNEPMKFWMNMLADGVLQTRLRTVDSTTSTTTYTNSDSFAYEGKYANLWENINSSNGYTKEDSATKSLTPRKYRYLIDTEQETVNIDEGPLLETQWGQDAPWNTYCPLKTDGSNERAPVGCTAVAGSQLLYYFATQLEWNISIPTRSYCVGDIDLFSRRFDDYSNNAWGDLALNFSWIDSIAMNKTAVLLAYVGELCDMEYSNTSSAASTGDLTDMIEELYGITSTKSDLWDYDDSIIVNSIQNDMPVLIWGAEDIFGGGHAWVTDGYRKEVIRTTKYYIISPVMLTQLQLNNLDKTNASEIVVEDSLVAEYIYMNWGWSGDYDYWFSLLPDDWSPTSDRLYDTVMRMYYNFSQNN